MVYDTNISVAATYNPPKKTTSVEIELNWNTISGIFPNAAGVDGVFALRGVYSSLRGQEWY